MKPPLPRTLSAVPQTLHTRLEIARAIRTLAGPDQDELLRQRRAEIAAVRGELEALPGEIRKAGEEWLVLAKAELRAALKKYNPDQPGVPLGNPDGGQSTREAQTALLKARPDDPKHPGWPAGTPQGRGGKFRPKDDDGSAAGVQYASGPHYPPPPPGYDPNTWKQGQWPNNNKYFLEDPEGNKYTVHPEDDRHWRHWDKQDGDNNDQGRWPPNSLKPRTGQNKLKEDQSLSDPNGDAPPWTPNPFMPVIPEPVFPIEPIPSFPISPILIPG